MKTRNKLMIANRAKRTAMSVVLTFALIFTLPLGAGGVFAGSEAGTVASAGTGTAVSVAGTVVRADTGASRIVAAGTAGSAAVATGSMTAGSTGSMTAGTIVSVEATSKFSPATQGVGELHAYAATKKAKVTWNATGGKVGKKSKVTKSIAINSKIGKLPVAKRAGYKFKGWYTKATGGTKITKNTKVTKNMTCYARWYLNMKYSLADSKGIKVYDFNFGEFEMKDAEGYSTKSPIAGIIAVPKSKGPHPLVIVFHGFTEIKKTSDKIYAGFDYLVKQLAAEGYVAISYNVNAPHHGGITGCGYQIYQKHMDLLKSANDGTATPAYGVDLKGQIDFDQVHLMGHSMGGGLADEIVREELAKGMHRIRSMVSIAGVVNETPSPDIPIGFIRGQYDGEVNEQEQQLFDATKKDKTRKTPTSIVFLKGANHANYCRTFLYDDVKNLPKEEQPKKAERLTRKQQEDFMVHYACAFLAIYAKGEEPWGIWNPNEPKPTAMFSYPVDSSYNKPKR